MKLFSGVLRAAISRSAAATSASVRAAGTLSGSARRMLSGTVSWISALSESRPMTRSISVASDASGPMWRSAKLCVRCDPDMTAPPRCPAVLLPESIPATQQAFASSSVGALRGSLHSTLSSVPIPARSICLRGSGPLLRRRRSCDQFYLITHGLFRAIHLRVLRASYSRTAHSWMRSSTSVASRFTIHQARIPGSPSGADWLCARETIR